MTLVWKCHRYAQTLEIYFSAGKQYYIIIISNESEWPTMCVTYWPGVGVKGMVLALENFVIHLGR